MANITHQGKNAVVSVTGVGNLSTLHGTNEIAALPEPVKSDETLRGRV